MKRLLEVIQEEVKRDPLGYTVSLVTLIACFALYQDVRGLMPWYLFVVACIIGLSVGLILVVFVIKKILEKTD